MNIEDAKGLVIKAGIKLVESGLIARTWGNVSCRISDSDFVITPSGRDYLTLTPGEIVTVKISDCSYTGSVKPSSEKGIHAEVYKLYPNINFVIHTHQEYASVISASELDSVKLPSTYEYLSNEVLCAAYGLPGTKKLCKNVSKALSNTTARAVIMKHHGALCFGENFEETFATAEQLESACYNFILARYLKLSKKPDSNTTASTSTATDAYEMANFALSSIEKTRTVASGYHPLKLYNSMRITNGFTLFEDTDDISHNRNTNDANCTSTANNTNKTNHSTTPNKKKPKSRNFSDTLSSGTLPKEAVIHDSIYKCCKSINYVLHANTPEIVAVANSRIPLKPLLDDFAQIVGTLVKNIEFDPNNVDLSLSTIAAALSKSSVVLIPNYGALCCGKTKDDAIAAQLITEKACKTLIGAAILGKVSPINPLECMLMRFIYLKKYSKQIDNNPK